MITYESQGAVQVVTAAAPLNADYSEPLIGAVKNSTTVGLPMVVLDLSKSALIDSAGLECLLEAREAVRSRGGTIKLAGLNPLVRDILNATGVGDHFQTYETAKAAVGSFSR